MSITKPSIGPPSTPAEIDAAIARAIRVLKDGDVSLSFDHISARAAIYVTQDRQIVLRRLKEKDAKQLEDLGLSDEQIKKIFVARGLIATT